MVDLLWNTFLLHQDFYLNYIQRLQQGGYVISMKVLPSHTKDQTLCKKCTKKYRILQARMDNQLLQYENQCHRVLMNMLFLEFKQLLLLLIIVTFVYPRYSLLDWLNMNQQCIILNYHYLLLQLQLVILEFVLLIELMSLLFHLTKLWFKQAITVMEYQIQLVKLLNHIIRFSNHYY